MCEEDCNNNDCEPVCDSNRIDNWGNKSTLKCLTCNYFVKKNGPTFNIGRCRRHAPTLNGWPVVYISDWCGDHKMV